MKDYKGDAKIKEQYDIFDDKPFENSDQVYFIFLILNII